MPTGHGIKRPPPITRFGGVHGSNTAQYIDLTSVTYSGASALSYSFSGTTAGGELIVTSGGTVVAEIDLIGNY